MASFAPLNIEIESESEDEVDDSKEIQIEEALKLYQNALKLHSQGPGFYDEAEDAYNELFRSEIFTYPESLSEAQRIETYGAVEELEDDSEDDLFPAITTTSTGVDVAPSSLPQILYLAYKNRGQFQLDKLKARLSRIEQEIKHDDQLTPTNLILDTAESSLKLFVEALDRDDTDLELWRQVARIAGLLGSRRIARFCLESVVDTDEGDFDPWTEPLGLEESFAREQLKPLLRSLNDQLSESQFTAKSHKSRNLLGLLKRNVDPLLYLPPSAVSRTAHRISHLGQNQIIAVPLRTWASCGKAILFRLTQEAQGLVNADPGAGYSLLIPSNTSAVILPPPARQMPNRDPTTDHDRQSFVRSPTEDKAEYVDALMEVSTADGPAEGNEDRPIDLTGSVFPQATGSPTKIDQAGDRGPGNAVGVQLKQARAENGEITVRSAITVALPTRKRSSETADLPDPTDIGRSRSKRIKARGSIDPDSLKDTTAEDWAKWYEQQLQIYHEADDPAFGTVESILAKLGSKNPGSLKALRDIVSNQPTTSSKGVDTTKASLNMAAQDLKTMLDGWDLPKSKAFLSGHDAKEPAGPIGGTQNPGFTTFLEHSTQEIQASSKRLLLPGDYALDSFAKHLDSRSWQGLHQLSYEWVACLLGPGKLEGELVSLYEASSWPDSLKQAVVQLLVNDDEAIFLQANRLVDMMEQEREASDDALELERSNISKTNHVQFVQAIFELHLDVYGRITNPSSKVDAMTRLLQRDRLCRWAAFSSKLMNQWCLLPDNESWSSGNLEIRFMWSSVVCTSLLEPALRDHTVLCFQDLIRILNEARLKHGYEVIIDLPNNAIMPEISVEAAEKEISRLTTLDFFMGIFSSENNDSLTIIESLEPLLDLSVQQVKAMDETSSKNTEGRGPEKSPTEQSEAPTNPKLLQALQFLNRGSLPLKLFLWQRLRNAYQAIHYPPQVLSCNLRSFALITNHLASSSYTDSSPEVRHDNLLQWLNKLDDLLNRILSAAILHNDAFETLDANHVRISLEALARLRDILHVFALWEDTIRVGKTQVPASVNQTAHRGLSKSTDKFRDMIVRTWTLQYILLKEAIKQSPESFTNLDEILLHYLKRVHQTLGLRCYCSLADKIFLKLMKTELERFKLAEGWDTDMAQLVFDLYGLKISSTTAEMQDHGCFPEELDRRTAVEVMDTVMLHVNRLSIKDLLKSDLKFAVDKMQQVIKIPKVTTNATARTFNYRLANNYLKSPINPVDLYRSLRGIGGLCGNPARSEGSEIAAKGWYFLLGHIALAKFRSQKRSHLVSTDDLEIARTFFRHDLEFDTERWETWYRLAQVYDAMIEEESTWTADKLDNHMADLAVLQRKAIHCYAMAMAVGTRCGDASFEGTSKMADLCADFGTRIYASTREPFSMRAFDMNDFMRPFNRAGQGMYENHQFPGMALYSAWKFASFLLRRASIQKPQDWVVSYMLGKVLWKMHSYGDNVLGNAKRIGYQVVIDAFVRAIESCPDKRDSRHPDKDPILEPHYKFVSVIHKLRLSKRISVEEGCRILKATPYSRKVPDVQDAEDWASYILQVIKALRSADKANWHHRMVARAAHIIYNNSNEAQAALDAKHEITQQIFTKTMAIQVWKPDNERAGRHFVYTGRYVRFFVRLLYQLNDRSSLEALARRIRKKAGDYVGHVGIWQEVCHAYLKLLRSQPYCKVPDRYQEDVFTGMNPETFQLNASRLEASIHSTMTNSPIIEILREAIEFKKLNNNYFKSGIFEELIGDIYAHLYDTFVPEIIAKETAEENRVRMRLDNILAAPTNAAETPPPDQAGELGAERRTKANRVTPREIIRKAEAIAARPAPTVPAKALKSLAPAPASEQDKAAINSPVIAVVIHEDTAREPGSSVPGSVHDSADDESELSEVDDEVAEDKPANAVESRPPLFPNLVKVGTNESASGDTNGGGFVTANEAPDDEEDDDDDDDDEEEMGAPQEQQALVNGRGGPEEQEPQEKDDAMEL